ncbi:MAG: ASCH domain-containing protein [Verrucomicrobiota bacterium]|nr:ASCH domain-containing protein [Verrucomicrobiota bacterium]
MSNPICPGPTSVVWEITLNDPWFDFVQSGEKVYEGRRYTEKVRQYKVGDSLQISHYTDRERPSFRTKITEIKVYRTFQEALEQLRQKV